MTISKPWGFYSVLVQNDRFTVKELVLFPGASISYQLHNKRNEIWYIQDGLGSFVLDDVEQEVKNGDLLEIKSGQKHRVTNLRQDKVLKIHELQYGELCDENDIVRFTDNYGRATV